MMKTRLIISVFVFCGALFSCHPNLSHIQTAHDERALAIENEYTKAVDKNDAKWRKIERQIKKDKATLRIKVVRDEDGKLYPAEPVSDRFVRPWGECSTKQAQEDCEDNVRAQYYLAVGRHYFLANFDWVNTKFAEKPALGLERLATYSHNKRLRKITEEKLREVEAHKAEFRKVLARLRDDRVEASNEQRDREVEIAKKKHAAFLAVLGESLAQFGKDLRRGRDATSTSSMPAWRATTREKQIRRVSDEQKECSSDFSCRFGEKCVKPKFRSNGVCMKAVDEYGLPTYEGPDLDSIGPNMEDGCSLLTDCPIGFRCDSKSGVCIR